MPRKKRGTEAARAAALEAMRLDLKDQYPSRVRFVDGPRRFNKAARRAYYRVYLVGRRNPVYLPADDPSVRELVREWRTLKALAQAGGAPLPGTERLEAAIQLLAASLERLQEELRRLQAEVGRFDPRLAALEAQLAQLQAMLQAAAPTAQPVPRAQVAAGPSQSQAPGAVSPPPHTPGPPWDAWRAHAPQAAPPRPAPVTIRRAGAASRAGQPQAAQAGPTGGGEGELRVAGGDLPSFAKDNPWLRVLGRRGG